MKAQIDGANLIRNALFQVNPGWYDSYWYGVRSDPRPHLIRRCIGSLRDLIMVVRVRRSAELLRQDAGAINQQNMPRVMT